MMNEEQNDMRDDPEMQHASDDWLQFAHDLKTNQDRRRRVFYGGISLVSIILIILISVSVSSANKNKHQEPPPPTYATVAEEKKELYELVQDSLDMLNLPTDDLLLVGSYQNKAFDWLSENANLESYDDNHKMQRFGMACFYFATYQVSTKSVPNPDPWVYEEYWLTDKHECDWAGVQCTAAKRIHSILLEQNKLSGILPFELALLNDSLKGLDLSSNSIEMNMGDMDIFRHLSGLTKILLDDNYLTSSNGLPASLTFCTDLRKLRLSNNLFDGPLDNGILNNLQKLTHLEIESNFLTGALPFLGEMTELRHIYLRRNEFTSRLNFLKTPASQNIKELWLDGNAISQSIPTQIGKLTHLESLSIANTQLTGTLPTELGQLTNLRRVWLSNNQLSGQIPSELKKLSALELLKIQENDLTGTIPDGVCSIVNASVYEHKAIVADCDKVKCSCCNECGV